MGALSKNGKYFIIRNLQNVINNTLTVINMASSEALTASVILTDAVYSKKKWILTIASTISDISDVDLKDSSTVTAIDNIEGCAESAGVRINFMKS